MQNEEEQIEPQQQRSRPIRGIKIGAIIGLCVAALAVLGLVLNLLAQSHVLSFMKSGSTTPEAVDPRSVAAFRRQGDADTEKLRRQIQDDTDRAQRYLDTLGTRMEANGIHLNDPRLPKELTQPDPRLKGTPTTAPRVDEAEVQRQQEERQAAEERARARAKRIQASLDAPGVIIDVSEKKQKEDEPGESNPAHDNSGPHAARQSLQPVPEQNTAPAQQKKFDAHGFTDYDQYVGKLHKVFEGRHFECVIVNRLTGDADGPIRCMVISDFFAENHQDVLVPQGSELLGTTSAVNSQNQRRLFAVFHLLRMPDGFTVSLDQFKGLSPQGDIGIAADVNHHYVQVFGLSVVLASIGGLAQIGNSTSGYGYDPMSSWRNGVSNQVSQEAMQILEPLMHRLPTLSKKPGAPSNVYIADTFELPLLVNHRMDPDL